MKLQGSLFFGGVYRPCHIGLTFAGFPRNSQLSSTQYEAWVDYIMVLVMSKHLEIQS